MQYLASFIISAITFIGLYNYLPLDLVALNNGDQTFGSTITTIQGSDTLSASRSVINTNFANLNADKIENSTTSVKSITTLSSLASIGTITTGVWNGTAVTVPYGGTGSTTLSSNQILLGNGTGIVKTVTGFGSSGEVLMSNGAGTAPSWNTSSVNTTVSYNWSAHHIFSSLQATIASTTNATTTNLTVTGNAIFTNEQWNEKLYLDATTPSITSSTASTTIFSFSVPANTLSTGNAVICDYLAKGTNLAGQFIAYDVSYGNASTTIRFQGPPGGASAFEAAGGAKIILAADGATNDQTLTMQAFATSTITVNNDTAIDSTTAKNITFIAKVTDTSMAISQGVVTCELFR